MLFQIWSPPLTPSFVADAIAPSANNRYSVPYESSYPSHGYHILYKDRASKYNIWFLFYKAYIPLPQIGERNGETFRIEFCFLPRFSACSARISGLFCFTFAFSKNRFGETFVSKLPFRLL